MDGAAVETPFPPVTDGPRLTIALSSCGYSTLDFVLFFPARRGWDNNRGHDYHLPLPLPASAARAVGATGEARLDNLAREIIERETGPPRRGR